MSEAVEIKKVADSLKRDFEEFKKENDNRLAKIEKNGTAGSDREEKVDRISEALTDMEEKLEKFETSLNRANPSETTEQKKEKQSALAKSAFNKLSARKSLSQEEFEAYKNSFGEEYKNLDYYKSDIEGKELSVISQPDGGYLVRPEVSTEIGRKIFESSPIRELASVMTIASDSFEEPYDDDEPASGWVAELQPRAATPNAQLKVIRIPTHEVHASPKASQKILDDAGIDIEQWHSGKVVRKFSRDEANAFIAGNGVGKPKGITQYAAGDGFDMLEQVNSGAAAALTADGLISLQGALLEEFQSNATWLMKRTTVTAVRKLKDDQNRYLWSVDGGLLNEGPSASLLGRPVRFANDMPVVGAGNLAVAYGDFRMGYLVVDRIGTRVLRDPYTDKGSVIFYTTKRVGGGVRQFQAIKIQKVAS